MRSQMSDDAILREIGRRLSRRRIDLQLSQATLAEQAGISKRTVERVEAGHGAQTLSLIRILRVLDLLDGLAQWLPEPGPSPMDLLKRKGRTRQRVRRPAATDGDDAAPWSWEADE